MKLHAEERAAKTSGAGGAPAKAPFRPTVAPRDEGEDNPRRRRSGPPGKAKADKGHIWTPGPNAKTIHTEAGQGLAHYLVHQAKGKLSVRKARKALEDGCCRVNGRVETFGSYLLTKGDVIEFILPAEDTEHRFDKRRVLHLDQGVVAYDKPAFLPVTPQDGPKSWSLFDILKAQWPELQPVHRLDGDTSGIVLFARTPEVAKRLEGYFKDHTVEKTYLAIVRGHPRESGTHRSYLVKTASGKGFEQWKSGRGADAREAVTTWKVIERLGKYGSLVEVKPKTGRYHQIRIHFSEIGHSLYGDRQYGDRLDPVHAHRHLLHASEVLLPNPGGGPALHLECGLPADFREAMEQLRKL